MLRDRPNQISGSHVRATSVGVQPWRVLTFQRRGVWIRNVRQKNTRYTEKRTETQNCQEGNPVNTESVHIYFPYALCAPMQKGGERRQKTALP